MAGAHMFSFFHWEDDEADSVIGNGFWFDTAIWADSDIWED